MPEVLLGRHDRQPRRQSARKRIASGAARLVIGTHALLQETRRVPPARPGGHRRAAPLRRGAAGGAHRQGRRRPTCCCSPRRRSRARSRSRSTATSTCRRCGERPPGRGKVRTAIRIDAERERVLDVRAARSAVAGRQAYVVLPVIEESEKADLARGDHDGGAAPGAGTRTSRWAWCTAGSSRTSATSVMRRFRDGDDPGAGGDDGDRGGHRRAQRHRHGDRASGAVRPGAAAPAARPGGAGRRGELLHPAGGRRRCPTGSRPSRRRRTGSRWRSWTCEERGMGDLIGARQSGGITLRHARLRRGRRPAGDGPRHGARR